MAGQKNDYGKRSHYQSDRSPANGGGKRRNPEDERESNVIGPEDTVYRYLCPVKKTGSIIGRGGDHIKQLRADTNAKIRINELVPGCEERVVLIFSSGEETNCFEETGDLVSPAQDALFKVHEIVIAEEGPTEYQLDEIVTVRMLVPDDQIGCVIGKGGQVIQNIRDETRAQIRILSRENVPQCTLSSDEVLQISGDTTMVKKALFQIACRLHDNPSRSQHLLLSSSNSHKAGGSYVSSQAPSAGPYGDRSGSPKQFCLRLVCPTENVGTVIGKSGAAIKQIREESGAFIKVDSSATEGNDCLITVSAKEVFEEPSPTINAALLLQPRCSSKTEKDSGDVFFTRLLIPSSQVGCLIGKGGATVSEIRSLTRASIRIVKKEDLPRIASDDEDMVQLTGDINAVSSALLQVTTRLRANVFNVEGGIVSLAPAGYGSYNDTEIAGNDYGAYV